MFRFPVLLPPAVRARAGTDLDLSFSCPLLVQRIELMMTLSLNSDPLRLEHNEPPN